MTLKVEFDDGTYYFLDHVKNLFIVQADTDKLPDCRTCKYDGDFVVSEECRSCGSNLKNYERKQYDTQNYI